jgi:hypothetical protein
VSFWRIGKSALRRRSVPQGRLCGSEEGIFSLAYLALAPSARKRALGRAGITYVAPTVLDCGGVGRFARLRNYAALC